MPKGKGRNKKNIKWWFLVILPGGSTKKFDSLPQLAIAYNLPTKGADYNRVARQLQVQKNGTEAEVPFGDTEIKVKKIEMSATETVRVITPRRENFLSTFPPSHMPPPPHPSPLRLIIK